MRTTAERCGIAVMVLAAALASAVGAADEPPPDPDLLEYLGSWEESDADWMLFDESTVLAAGRGAEEGGPAAQPERDGAGATPPARENEGRSDPVPQGEESPESEDEN